MRPPATPEERAAVAGELLRAATWPSPVVAGEPDYDQLGATIHAIAADVAEAEARIRGAVVEALDRGDVARARALLVAWGERPPAEVAAELGG